MHYDAVLALASDRTSWNWGWAAIMPCLKSSLDEIGVSATQVLDLNPRSA